MRPHIVYWNNIPSPYMVERFNALVDRNRFDFEAWFNDRVAQDRSWNVDESTWRFRHRYLPTLRIAGRMYHWPLPILDTRPDALISLYAEPVFIIGWLVARLRGIKTGFRVLKTYDRWVKRHPLKDAMKRFMFKRADTFETTGEDGRQFALQYGAAAQKIFIARHTVDIPYFKNGCDLARVDRERYRHQLSLHGTTFIYVGRLWDGKGIDCLLEAFEQAQRQCDKEISLLIVGDGPDEGRIRQLCIDHGIRNVVFAGFQQKAHLPRYYAMSDVFVFPTLGDPYGLVVDEAMACSLPVISSSAAGEIHDRIEDGVNGYIVPPGESRPLMQRMMELVQDQNKRQRMGAISATKISDHTPEKWAEDFERMLNALLQDQKQ